MKVLILNTSERIGGAAVAASRLKQALGRTGTDVRMLVRDKQTSEKTVISVNHSCTARWINKFRFFWERGVIFLANKCSRKNLFRVSLADTGTDVSRLTCVKEADIIHLHWVNQGFLSLKDIKKLFRLGKPVVWTLHDLWPATGICHYPDGCVRYRSVCQHCPMQVVRPFYDWAYKVFKQKQSMDWSQVTFVGCSRWIVAEAKKSALLQGARFLSIPNPIDQTFFRPFDRTEIRKKLGLPAGSKLLLFAAAKLSDERKGAAYFQQACRILKKQYNVSMEIILMGNSSEELAGLLPFRVNRLGYLSGPEALAAVYSAADVFVIPSLEDNLPNTIMEAMACGTPCVGFETGGIPEMIDHKRNGYVARYKDAADLAAGMQWVLESNGSLSDSCVEKVSRCYSEHAVAGQYRALYEKLLSERVSEQKNKNR